MVIRRLFFLKMGGVTPDGDDFVDRAKLSCRREKKMSDLFHAHNKAMWEILLCRWGN